MIHLLSSMLLLFAGLPSTSLTGWMQPASFQLSIGMSEKAALAHLQDRGWDVKEGKEKGQKAIDYDEGKSVTLGFSRGRLESIRFEYVGFVPQVQLAFEEARERLRRRRGLPQTSTEKILIYDTPSPLDPSAPDVTVILSADSSTSFGRQGLGFLVIRYFAPPAK
ncbi:MAG: hypothetical protein WBX15_12845 [Thermoanaerobaculia bacterium]